MSIALNDTLANFCCTKCTDTPKRTRARARTHSIARNLRPHLKEASTYLFGQLCSSWPLWSRQNDL